MAEKFNLKASLLPIIAIILSILIFLLMLAPLYNVDEHNGKKPIKSYNIYEVYTLEKSDYIGPSNGLYEGNKKLTNHEYKELQLESLEKEYKELVKIDTDKETLAIYEYRIETLKYEIMQYDIAISMFVLNTLFLAFAIVCLSLQTIESMLNSSKAVTISHTIFVVLAYVTLFAVFVCSCILCARINHLNLLSQQMSYMAGAFFHLTARSPIALIFFTFLPFGAFLATDIAKLVVGTIAPIKDEPDSVNVGPVPEEPKDDIPPVEDDIKVETTNDEDPVELNQEDAKID